MASARACRANGRPRQVHHRAMWFVEADVYEDREPVFISQDLDPCRMRAGQPLSCKTEVAQTPDLLAFQRSQQRKISSMSTTVNQQRCAAFRGCFVLHFNDSDLVEQTLSSYIDAKSSLAHMTSAVDSSKPCRSPLRTPVPDIDSSRQHPHVAIRPIQAWRATPAHCHGPTFQRHPCSRLS